MTFNTSFKLVIGTEVALDTIKPLLDSYIIFRLFLSGNNKSLIFSL